jgi:hypothetical protein
LEDERKKEKENNGGVFQMMNLINTLKDKKNRRIVLSLGVIIVLVIFLVFSGKDKKSGDIPKIKSFDSADEIIIAKNNKQLRLFKKDNKWLINEQAFPADKSKAEYLEKEMKELNITDFISKEPYLAKYELNPEKAVRITVKGNGKVYRDIFIGKASSTFRSAYIKFENDPRIFLANGNLSDEFNKDVEDLRDKQIYNVGRDEVVFFELVYGGKLSFEKKTEEVEEKSDAKDAKNAKEKDKQKEKKKTKVETWICKEYRNTAIDKNKVDSFVTSFSSISADSYSAVEKKDIKGLVCQIKVKVYNKEIEFKIHKKEKENYLCTSSESPYVFALREDNVKKYFKSLADFKQDAPPVKNPVSQQSVK